MKRYSYLMVLFSIALFQGEAQEKLNEFLSLKNLQCQAGGTTSWMIEYPENTFGVLKLSTIVLDTNNTGYAYSVRLVWGDYSIELSKEQ
ncbi:MAG TPA: hypothetical protein VN445_11595, partial [Rectinemataceae bacterium]|nr:hypothetical protein [Rectinemataceae bacterium]